MIPVEMEPAEDKAGCFSKVGILLQQMKESNEKDPSSCKNITSSVNQIIFGPRIYKIEPIPLCGIGDTRWVQAPVKSQFEAPDIELALSNLPLPRGLTGARS